LADRPPARTRSGPERSEELCDVVREGFGLLVCGEMAAAAHRAVRLA